MKILHITDYHFDSATPEYDARKIAEVIISDCSNQGIELILFTGDLVFSGKKPEDFQRANELLLDNLVQGLKVPKDQIFICPGNHDVFRGQELMDTASAIWKINSLQALEDFVKQQNGRSFFESLKNLENYFHFEKTFYEEFGGRFPTGSHPLYLAHKFNFGNIRIGVFQMNTAWRAIDSSTDRGNLLYPMSVLKDGVSEIIKNTDFRIIMHHHPISDFKDWNGSEIEDLIITNFHMSFSGHLHKRKLSTSLTLDGGIFSCTSPATLALDGTINGYTIIDVDLTTYEGTVDFRSFNRTDASIMILPSLREFKIPTGEIKSAAIELIKTIRKRYTEESSRADELIISHQDQKTNGGFFHVFTEPVLRSKSSSSIVRNSENVRTSSIDEISSSVENWVIYGKDKSGKTCIAYKLLLYYLAEYTIHKKIPLFIDGADYKTGLKTFDLVKVISRYYEMNNAKAINLIKSHSITLLIDNYDPKLETLNVGLEKSIEEFSYIKIIAFAEERMANELYKSDLINLPHNVLYIHDVSRHEVRVLANKWPNISDQNRGIILDKIFQIFYQLNIPTNFWTVSMFIWIFERNGDANFHNNFELIQLYIDNLLDRKRLALDRSLKIDFEEFKTYLGEFAFFLLLDRADKGYTATYTEIVDFTDGYRRRNRRFVISVEDIINLIIDKGIIRRSREDAYTFRLNGVFEYFLALYMRTHQDFRKEAINDDRFYLSFKNEFELYAGFEKNDEEFIEAIYDKTKQIFQEADAQYNLISIDKELINKLSGAKLLGFPLKQLKSSIKSLTHDEQDAILAEMQPNNSNYSEVRIKKYYEKIENNSENLERAITILARVYRNSRILDDKTNDKILNYIIERICYLGFTLIDEAKNEPESVLNNVPDEERGKILLKVLTTFMPLLIQTFMYDAIAQNDLERIFIDKIDQLKSDKEVNQFKLFILYLTLVDIDVIQNNKYLDDMMKVVEMPILRQSLLFKLYYYLMFKCNSTPNLTIKVKDLIQTLSLELQPKKNLGNVHKSIEKGKNIGQYRDKRK